MAIMDPPPPNENLVDHADGGSHIGDNSTIGSKDEESSSTRNDVNGNGHNGNIATPQVATISSNVEQESSSTPSRSGELKQAEDSVSDVAADEPQSKVQFTRQTLSEYQAAKQKAKQVKMAAIMSDMATLETEASLMEPSDRNRSSSWQPASSQGQGHSDAYNSVPNLPTSPQKQVSKTTAKRVPSSGSHSPKSIRLKNRARASDTLYSKSDHGPSRRHQNQHHDQHQSEKDVNLSYQRLRQQTSRPNRPVNTPMSGEDVKMGYATLLSRNHTAGAMPPGQSMGTASSMTMSWGGDGDDSSDDLTLLRDDDCSDEEDVRARHRPLNRSGNNNNSSSQTPGGAVFDEDAIKTQYARMGIAARRPLSGGGEGLPSQSEHGTKSTRMNQRRPASSHPFIDDDDDPRATTNQLEAELIRKSLSMTNDASQEAAQQETEEDRPWPSALAYDPTRPGAHGIHAPGSQETPDRREGFERYDSYLTSRDQYLVSATLVDKDDDDDDEDRRKLAKDRSERFRLLESRQAELEQQIAEQKNLILKHNEELNRLKNSHGEIVQAEVVGDESNTELGRQIRQRESIIAEKEAELSTLMGRSIPGMGLLKRYDQKKEKKKKGKLMSKLNPFRKTTETIRELDEDNNSLMSSSTHSKKQSSHHKRPLINTSSHERDEDGWSGSSRGGSGSFRGDMDVSGHDASENNLPSREALLLETKKRSERFIAPEKLPFDDHTISELKQTAEDANVDISGCVERGQIVKRLQEAGVKPKKKGPLNKFFGKSKSPKNSLNKSSSHSLNMSSHSKKTPKKENKRVVDIPPDDMPAPMVMEKQDSFYAPKQIDVFDGISISQLKKIAQDRNVDVTTCTDRTDLVNVLYAAGMRPQGEGDPPKDPLHAFSISELKRLAHANNVDISSCVEKGQIIGALNVAGVRAPKKGSATSSGGVSWEKLSISELKKIARDKNVDVSMCVEKTEIISKLRRAGVPPSPSNVKKAAPRLSRGELAEWRPAQLQILAIHIGATSSGSAGSGDLLSKIIHVANEEKKKLRAPIRAIASLGPAPLGKLRNFAKEKRVDISGCVEKDEMLQRIVQKYVR